MGESKRKVPNFQPGDGVYLLATKVAGRVTEWGGAEFEDGTYMDSIDLRDAWGNGLGWAPRNRIGRSPRKKRK